MGDFANLRLDIDGAIATITIDRPDAMNALDVATLDELGAAVDAAVEAGARGLLITGAGKAFVAGADIASMRGLPPEKARVFAEKGNQLFRRIEKLPIPVVAAVNGFALGGGCELALSCDFIYASEKARFGQPEVQLGLLPGFGGTQRLPRKVSWGVAMELLLSGRMVRADEALRVGLVNRVVPPEELLGAARASLEEILTKGPVAVAETKRLAQATASLSLDDGLRAEVEAFGRIFATGDSAEGIAAFLEKRPPNFSGS